MSAQRLYNFLNFPPYSYSHTLCAFSWTFTLSIQSPFSCWVSSNYTTIVVFLQKYLYSVFSIKIMLRHPQCKALKYISLTLELIKRLFFLSTLVFYATLENLLVKSKVRNAKKNDVRLPHKRRLRNFSWKFFSQVQSTFIFCSQKPFSFIKNQKRTKN